MMRDPHAAVGRAALAPAARAAACWLALCVVCLTGCGLLPNISFRGPAGDPALRPIRDDLPAIELPDVSAVYAFGDENTATLLALDGPPDTPRFATVIRFLWTPKAGLTAIDPGATNATVTVYDFRDPAGVAVYTGAGFAFNKQDPGGSTLTLDLWQVDLIREDGASSAATVARDAYRMTGRFTARRDDRRTTQQLDELSRTLSDALGRPRLALR